MLSAEDQGKQLVLQHVSGRFAKKMSIFLDSLKKNNRKTFKTLQVISLRLLESKVNKKSSKVTKNYYSAYYSIHDRAED